MKCGVAMQTHFSRDTFRTEDVTHVMGPTGDHIGVIRTKYYPQKSDDGFFAKYTPKKLKMKRSMTRSVKDIEKDVEMK